MFCFFFVPLTCTICFHILTRPSATSEPLQSLPLCLKQEMSPEVTSTSPSPHMAASNLAFMELQALQKPVSVSSSCSSNHFPNAFNSFSHHAPVYGQFGSQSVISGNAGHPSHPCSYSLQRHLCLQGAFSVEPQLMTVFCLFDNFFNKLSDNSKKKLLQLSNLKTPNSKINILL